MKKAIMFLAFVLYSMTTGAQVIFKYDKVYNFSEGRAVVSMNDKYGIINQSGAVVVPLEYDYIVDYSEGMAAVFKQEELPRESGYRYFSAGFVDTTGTLVIPMKYSCVMLPFGDRFEFKEGVASVEWGSGSVLQKGLIDKKGNEIATYSSVETFHEGLAVVGNDNDKSGVINKKGKLVIPYKYDYIGYFEYGFADAELAERTGLIDSEGNEIIPLQYDFVYPLSEDLIVAEQGEERALFDKSGQVIADFGKYDDFGGDVSSGLLSAKRNGRWGYIDLKGEEQITFQYEDCGRFSEELAPVSLNGKWGFIDNNSKETIPNTFEEAFSFSEGLAKVKHQGKYGFIDKKGQFIIPPKYDEANHFKDGLVAVCRFEKWGFIDKTGKPLEIKE